MPTPAHPTSFSVAKVAKVACAILFAALGVALMGGFTPRTARAESPPPPQFLVIANPKNPVNDVTREFLADAFLKKVTRWDDGETIRPVDLGPTSGVRRIFSEKILDRSVAAVRSYWQQRIFSGRDLPPPELASDDAVVEYVQRNRGAVGYVASSPRPHDVKILVVR